MSPQGPREPVPRSRPQVTNGVLVPAFLTSQGGEMPLFANCPLPLFVVSGLAWEGEAALLSFGAVCGPTCTEIHSSGYRSLSN